MPRYFSTSTIAGRDWDGLPDLASARIAAIRFAGDYLSDNPRLISDGQEQGLQVRQEDDGIVFTIVVLMVKGRLSGRRAVN